MKHALFANFLLSLALTTSAHAQTETLTFARNGITETYQGNMDTGELTISWGKKSKVFAETVGYVGQTSRALVSFNGAPALTYSNAGSNTSFEVFYTLAIKDNVPVINCVYGNIRNGQNGASIRKAVCNLNEPLSSEYQDLIFFYSDKWIMASSAVSLKSVMAEPSQPADAPLGRLGEIDVALRYSTVEELMSAEPKTIATAGEKTHEVSNGNAYLVYDADGTTPLALDVETDSASHTLKRMTSTELLRAIEATAVRPSASGQQKGDAHPLADPTSRLKATRSAFNSRVFPAPNLVSWPVEPVSSYVAATKSRQSPIWIKR